MKIQEIYEEIKHYLEEMLNREPTREEIIQYFEQISKGKL